MNLAIMGLILLTVGSLGLLSCIFIDNLCDKDIIASDSLGTWLMSYIAAVTTLIGGVSGIGCLVGSLIELIVG